MGLVIDPTAYIIGAADVYYRAVGGTGVWTPIGATTGDVIFRVTQSTFNPSETFNGLLEPVREMDYLSKQSAEAEFEMPEFAGEKLKLAVLGVTVAAVAAADAGGGWSTTISAAAAAGATSVTLTSAAGVTVGDIMHLGAAGLSEYRVIDLIAGSVVSFRDPLRLDHASAAVAVKATADGKTEITPGFTRRQPLTAYNDFALIAQSPASYYELFLMNAISTTQQAEIAFKDQGMAAIKVTLGTRRDGLNLSNPSWRLRVPAA